MIVDDTTSNVPAIAGGIAGPGGFLLLSVCIIVLLVVLYKRKYNYTTIQYSQKLI